MSKTLACCYTRFSTENQNENSTIGQLRAIKQYCDKNNIQLIKVYSDEAQSGTNMNRQSFQQLLNDAPTAAWDTVIVYNMSRLSRSVKDTLIIKENFKKMGKKIISLIENQDDTPEGEFFNLITYGMNELFVKQFKRDTWRGLITNAMDCKTHGGVPPLGYTVSKERKYIINPQEAPIIKIIFDKFCEGWSYKKISEYLNNNGFTNRGKKFRPFFTDTLRNEKYKGVYVWNLREGKDKLGKKTNRIYKNDSEVIRIKGGIPAIITEETFNLAQNILDTKKYSKRIAINKSKYLLSSILECGCCAQPFNGGYTFSGRNKTYRSYYKCNGLKKTPSCKQKDINMEYLDSYILDLTKNILLNISFSETYKTEINKFLENRAKQITTQIEKLKNKNKELNIESKEFAERIINSPETDFAYYTTSLGQIVLEKNNIEKEILELEQSKTNISKLTNKLVSNKIKTFKKEFINNNEIKKILQTIISKISIDNTYIKTFVNLSNIFFSDTDNQADIIICFVEDRNKVSLGYSKRNIDFSKDRLKEAFKNNHHHLVDVKNNKP